jgi:predicted RNA binding protein YcfA (HicA-like mRNA interferase family)
MIKNINARVLIRTLHADGFEIIQQSGSHRVFKHKDGRRIVIAYHHLGETIPIGTLKAIIDSTEWCEKDLIRLKLKKR